MKFFHCILARNINSYLTTAHDFISLDDIEQNYQNV